MDSKVQADINYAKTLSKWNGSREIIDSWAWIKYKLTHRRHEASSDQGNRKVENISTLWIFRCFRCSLFLRFLTSRYSFGLTACFILQAAAPRRPAVNSSHREGKERGEKGKEKNSKLKFEVFSFYIFTSYNSAFSSSRLHTSVLFSTLAHPLSDFCRGRSAFHPFDHVHLCICIFHSLSPLPSPASSCCALPRCLFPGDHSASTPIDFTQRWLQKRKRERERKEETWILGHRSRCAVVNVYFCSIDSNTYKFIQI